MNRNIEIGRSGVLLAEWRKALDWQINLRSDFQLRSYASGRDQNNEVAGTTTPHLWNGVRNLPVHRKFVEDLPNWVEVLVHTQNELEKLAREYLGVPSEELVEVTRKKAVLVAGVMKTAPPMWPTGRVSNG